MKDLEKKVKKRKLHNMAKEVFNSNIELHLQGIENTLYFYGKNAINNIEQYGEKTYNKYLRKFKQKEIEDVYGKRSFKALKGRIKLIGAALLTATGVKYGVGHYIRPTLEAVNFTTKNAEALEEEL